MDYFYDSFVVFSNLESPIQCSFVEKYNSSFLFSFFFSFGPLGRDTGVWNGMMKINEIFWFWVNCPLFFHFPNCKTRYNTIRSLNSACYWNNNFPTNSVSQTRFTDAHPPPSTQKRNFSQRCQGIAQGGCRNSLMPQQDSIKDVQYETMTGFQNRTSHCGIVLARNKETEGKKSDRVRTVKKGHV